MVIHKIDLSLKIIFKDMLKNLTALVGLLVGISLFVIMFFILRDSKSNFLYNFDKLGSGFIKIQTLNFNNDNKYYLKLDDIRSLKCSELPIKYISPEAYLKGTITNKFTSLGCHIIGGSEDYSEFMVMDMMFGRFFSDYECVNKENVMVIDNFTSMKLFGVEDSLGREIYIGDKGKLHKYKVIGVMKNPFSILEKTLNISSFCIIPIGNFIGNFKINSFFDYIYVSFEKNEDIYNISNSIINFLKARNGVSRDIYQIENFVKQENYIKNMTNIFTKIIKIITVVSIFLNGLNIMNFMIYSINGRTREFETKKCIGANKFDIFVQVIYESIILCFFIGIGSLFIGTTFSYFMCLFMNMQFKFNILNIFMLIIIFIFMGLIFGIIPALKACKIKPIDYLES